MNCIEKLHGLYKQCEPCVAKVIEFEKLPEELKYEADYYDKDKDFLIYCEKCEFYGIIESS
jgi:hypothetical protein